MKPLEKAIFFKAVEYLSDKVPSDALIMAFGSRVRKTRGKKFDFDLMIKTSEASKFCGKTLGKIFERENELKDDEGRLLGKDVFMDIQLTTAPIYTKNHLILYKDGKIQN